MGGIYIKGMKMPPVGTGKVIMIDSDGDVLAYGKDECTIVAGAKAVPVPEHGDLIERQAVLETFSIHMNRGLHFVTIRDTIPTIIPAEPPKEETV